MMEVLTNPSALWIILAGACCGASCAILGCFLVLRRMSLLGDAISHAVLPGIVVAFLVTGRLSSWPILIGALALGFLTAFLSQSLQSTGKVPEDSSLGVVFTSLFALGVVLINLFASRIDLDPGCVLYGLIEFVPLDIVEIGPFEIPRGVLSLTAALLLVVLFVVIFWKELKISSFDAGLSSAMGFPAMGIHYALMAMVALVTVASFEAVGSVLVVAMLIVPAATAHLLSDRLGWMIIWAILASVLSAILGYLADAAWNTGVAGMMAVAAGAIFFLAVLLAPRRGLVSKAWNQGLLSLRIAGEDVIGALYRQEELADQREPIPSVTAQLALTGSGRGARLAIPWLLLRGDVRRAGPQWELTDQGRRRAQGLVRAHRLWESYLAEHFDLPLDHVHDAAERVEHYLGPSLQREIATELSAPQSDPQGKAIPSDQEP